MSTIVASFRRKLLNCCISLDYCSEFADIFDLDHFKNVLANDVRIVSSLPSTHLMTRPVEEKRTPLHASPEWIRSRYLRRVSKLIAVLLFLGFDFITKSRKD